MNFEEVLSVIKAARSGKKNESLDRMLGNFENLLVLMQDHQEMSMQDRPPSKDDVQQIRDRLMSSVKGLQGEYAQFCEKNNKSPEEMKEYFDNPSNFSTEAWEQIQEFHRRFGIGDGQAPQLQATSNSRKIGKKSKKKSKKWSSV